VDFAGLHFEGEAFEDFAIRDTSVEVCNDEAHEKMGRMKD
jgi:hypothetical protein